MPTSSGPREEKQVMRIRKPAASNRRACSNPHCLETNPWASGRCLVRPINRSAKRSCTLFRLAAPAASSKTPENTKNPGVKGLKRDKEISEQCRKGDKQTKRGFANLEAVC